MESSKYGLVYALSNNWIGMLFNDKTKIISNASGETAHYITSRKSGEQTIQCTLIDFPEYLYKKIMILQLLKKQLGFKETVSDDTKQVHYIKN